MLEHPEEGVPVYVGPPGDDHRRDGDRVVVRPKRALSPERPVVLLLDRPEPWHQLLDAFQPEPTPVFSGKAGNGWKSVHRHHGERVAELHRLSDPAAEMNVIRVAIVRRVYRDDGLQGRGPRLSDLDRVEPRVGGAEHPHGAGAPLLPRQPIDDLAQVVLFLRWILGRCDSLGGSRATDIDAANRIASLIAQPPVLGSSRSKVVFAI